jgi:hypothetical protein
MHLGRRSTRLSNTLTGLDMLVRSRQWPGAGDAAVASGSGGSVVHHLNRARKSVEAEILAAATCASTVPGESCPDGTRLADAKSKSRTV